MPAAKELKATLKLAGSEKTIFERINDKYEKFQRVTRDRRTQYDKLAGGTTMVKGGETTGPLSELIDWTPRPSGLKVGQNVFNILKEMILK